MPYTEEPQDVLSPEEYSNYRWVRVAIWIFLVGGGFILFCGVAGLYDPIAGAGLNRQDEPPFPLGLLIVTALAGLAAVLGGIAGFHGNRRWAWLGANERTDNRYSSLVLGYS